MVGFTLTLLIIYQESTEPLSHTHFVAEGEVSFKSILYLPAKAPAGMFNDYGQKKTDSIKVKNCTQALVFDACE